MTALQELPDRIIRGHVVRSLSALVIVACLSACDTPPDPRRTNFRVERGNVAAQYDDKTGRLRRLEVDSNKNGKVDTWSYSEGTRIDRIEIDRDEDGKLDRWEYYGANNVLEKVGTSSRGDGVADEWAFQNADGTLARVESDTDRDGRIDKWETFDPPAVPGGPPVLRAVATEPDAQGRPTRRLVYRPDGSFERSERLDVDVKNSAAGREKE